VCVCAVRTLKIVSDSSLKSSIRIAFYFLLFSTDRLLFRSPSGCKAVSRRVADALEGQKRNHSRTIGEVDLLFLLTMSIISTSVRGITTLTIILIVCMLPKSLCFHHGRRASHCSRGLWKRFAQQPQNLCSGPGGTTGNIARSDKSEFVANSNNVMKSIVMGSTLLQSFAGSAIADSTSSPGARNAKIEVRKKPLDERLYRALELDNGMRVLLVSDPSSSRSAAALDVNVGSFSDPREVPGLAHFCEHMSFLGTKRFPKEEEFSSYLSSHGGSSNAYTDSEDTVYYFDVNAEFTEEALDRFSQFFISPLFTQSATSRELNAIDSEHAKNINSDSFRLYQVRSISNLLHPEALHKINAHCLSWLFFDSYVR
jgi:Insulinase (Peptidase family M16)